MQSGPYTLIEVSNMLNVARSLLNFNEVQLLKLSHDAEIAEAFAERLAPKLKLQINDSAEFCNLVTATFDELERELHSFNRNHLLAYLFTHYFQKGQLLNLDSMSAVNCWHILHVSLKELKKSSTLDADAVEGLWLGFIGQLLKTNNINTANAIHDYLHLGYNIAHSVQCGMGVSYTAKVIGSPLLEGLQLKERLDQNALAQEYVFMAKVCNVLLTLPIFSQSFKVECYLPWSLPKGAIYSIQATLLGALGDSSTPSIFNSYSTDVIKMQGQLAQRMHVKEKSRTNQGEFDLQDQVMSVTDKLANFTLVPQAELLSQYQQRRSNPQLPQQDVVESSSLEQSSSETKKSRKSLSDKVFGKK